MDAIPTPEMAAVTAFIVVRLQRTDRIAAFAGESDASARQSRWLRELMRILRENDRLAVVHADEFWFMLPRLPHSGFAELAAQKINTLLFRMGQSEQVPMRPLAGIALTPTNGTEAMQLIARAESALELAALTPEGFALAKPMVEDDLALDKSWEIELRQALRGNALEVHFQPQVDLRSGECVGVEALLRWLPASGKRVSPALIAEHAERSELIQPLTLFVVNYALRAQRNWKAAGQVPRLSINLSPKMLSDEEFPGLLRQLLNTWGTDPRTLMFEITESSVVGDVDRSIAMMKRLKEIGVQLSMDDFGTGYSSLAYLRRFPLDELKIDRMFVRSVRHHKNDQQIVRSVIDLAHNFELTAVAEGVEDRDTLHLLREMGCDLVQGFVVSKALSPDTFVNWRMAYDRLSIFA